MSQINPLSPMDPDVFYPKTTPLMIASTYACDMIVKKLLEHNAEILYKDCEGNTAISMAHKRGHEDIVQLLAKEGI